MKNRARTPLFLPLLAAIVLLAAVSGCGSSSGSSSSTTGSTAGAGGGESASKGAASSFIKPNNPNNKYAKFGKEASPAIREAASIVLNENLKAREGRDFATQCATLNASAVQEIAKANQPSKAKAECPAALKKLAEPFKSTKEFRADWLGGQIDAFRVKGKEAYALFHGTDGNNWMMLMTEEGGVWKAGSIVTVEVG